MKEETGNYINNARLDPDWIGREVNLGILPDEVRRWVAQLAAGGRGGKSSVASIVYMPKSSGDAVSALP